MSAEVEVEKSEENVKEVQPQKVKKTLKQTAKENWQVGLKVLQLLISAVCMGIVYEPAKTTGFGGKAHMDHIGIMYTAFTGYMIINSVFLISRAMKDRIPYKTTALFSVCGSAIFLVAGILLIVYRTYLIKHYAYHPQMYLLTMLTTTIVFTFVNVLIFAVDAIFTFKRQEDF